MASSFGSSNGENEIDSLIDSLTANENRTADLSGRPPRSPDGDSNRAWSGLVLAGLVGFGFAAIVGSLVLSWLALSRSTGSDEANSESVVAEGPLSDVANRIQSVLQDLGLSDVQVAQSDSTIVLVGSVSDQSQRNAAISAAQALADDGMTVDGSALVVGPAGVAAVDTTAAAEQIPAAGDERALAFQQEIDRVLAVSPLIFGRGESELNDRHFRVLDDLVTVMTTYPDMSIRIIGFTDDSGDTESNRALSLKRAERVRSYLVSRGIVAASLSVDARGEEASTGSSELANLERRVAFEVGPASGSALASSDNLLRVGIVAPSASNDLAFTQSMIDAVNVVAGERGSVEVDITDNTFVESEAEAALREYAAEDYDLVIAHGSQFGGLVLGLAKEYPDVAFAWGTASDSFGLPNVYAYDVTSEQGGFVQGAMAAALTTTGTIGVVAPIEIGDAKRYVDGFVAGARAESPGVEVLVAYTGSFSNTEWAADAANEHIAAGADVLTGSSQMVVGAVEVAMANDVLWLGSQSNQSSLAPGHVVASQVYHWEVVLRSIIVDIDSGTLSGTVFSGDFANGGLVIEYNPDFAVSGDAQRRADQLVGDISTGTLRVPVQG